MSEGQSVADLLLKIGVDAGEMISGFNGTARQARQMAKDMAEGINASLQKAFDPAAVNSGQMFQNLETQYRATVSTMLRESIQARAVIERSAENVKRFALEAAEADQRVMGELLTEQANFYNVKQGLRTAELANIQATANQELEIQKRSLDMQAALRKRYAAEIAAFEAETAADKQQRMINEANQRDALQFHARRNASLENMKSITDAETEILARSTALREDILERYRLKRQEETEREIAEETRANEARIAMLRESIEARAILERSAANINQAASESMIAGMTKVGGVQFDPMISKLNAAAKKQLEDSTRQAAEAAKAEANRRQDLINKYNQEQSAARELTAEKKRLAQETADASTAIKQRMEAEQAEQAIQDELLQRQNLINSYNTEQRELRETADAIRRNEEDYAGLVQQMRDAEAAGRRLSTARRLDAKDAEAAVRINQAGADQAAEALRRRASDEEDARRRTAAIMASERLAARNRTNAAREQADLDRRALTLRRSLITAQDAHNERLEEYNTLLRTARISQEEFNEAVRRSEQVMNSQRAGSSQMAGILAQLSFGLEDFAQGIAMGDLRAALLGASNNMTMVVRGLIDMSAASRTALVSTLAIPGAIALIGGTVVGLYAYSQWLHSATRDTRTLADAIRDAQLGLEKFNKTAEFQSQMRGMETSVSRMTSLEDVARREQDLINERIDAERNLQNVQREAAVEAQAMIDNMLGGAEARAELEKFITRTKVQGSQAEIEAAREIERLVAQSQEAARQGNAETVINNLRKVYELLNAGALDISDDLIADLTALDALEEFFQTNRMSFGFLGEQFRLAEEDADKLRELREKLLQTNEKLTEAEREQQKIAAELINLEIKRQELAKLRSEEMERQAKWAAAEQDQKQKEELFLIKATEHEKELFRLRQEQQKFVGEQNMQLMGLNPAANFGAMMQLGVQQVEAQADAMAFLEAQKQAAEAEIAALMQQAIPKAQGALEQDAFQAQADAFKQMTENLTQKPNPQLTQVVNRLGAIEAAIKNGGVFLPVGP